MGTTAPKNEKRTKVSLNPDDAISRGLFDNVRVRWVKCCFELFDYQGKGDTVTAAKINMEDLDTGEPYEQVWSAGSPKIFAPSEDGTYLVPQDDADTSHVLNKSSNFYALVSSLKAIGLPDRLLGIEDITEWEGLEVRMLRKPTGKKSEEGKILETLIAVELIALPGEGKSAKGAAKGNTQGAEPKSTAVEDAVLAVLATAIAPVPKRQLMTMVVKSMTAPADKAAAASMLNDDAYLGANERPWTYANGMISALA